jgi:hypothetical protein
MTLFDIGKNTVGGESCFFLDRQGVRVRRVVQEIY